MGLLCYIEKFHTMLLCTLTEVLLDTIDIPSIIKFSNSPCKLRNLHLFLLDIISKDPLIFVGIDSPELIIAAPKILIAEIPVDDSKRNVCFYEEPV